MSVPGRERERERERLTQWGATLVIKIREVRTIPTYPALTLSLTLSLTAPQLLTMNGHFHTHERPHAGTKARKFHPSACPRRMRNPRQRLVAANRIARLRFGRVQADGR